MMLNSEIINAMRREGALIVNKFDNQGNLHFHIDFKKVQELFPRFLDYLVRHNLGKVDLELYDEGCIAYFIQNDGQLVWKSTRKLRDHMI